MVSTQHGASRFSSLLLVAAVIFLVITVATFISASDPVPVVSDEIFNPGSTADREAQIEKGKYLALAGNCASCHTTEGGSYMAGGLAFETPFGTIYSTNITPDTETGIGNWTGPQFLDSMRRGVRPNGDHLYPVFPYTAFTKVTDTDIAALYAYFKSIPAARMTVPDNDIAFPFSQRGLMSVWKAMFFDAGVYQSDDLQSDEWNRGAYLVEALAHCSACHSPRNLLGAEDNNRAMAGGVYADRVRTGAIRPWFAPNLTSTSTGLDLWSQEDLSAYLKTGQNDFIETFGPMNEVILNSTRHLRNADVHAMTDYLKSLPAHEDPPGSQADSSVLGMGRTVYNLHCGTCHLPTGLGDVESAPRLAGASLVVQASNPASMINVILYGPQHPDPPFPGRRRNPMDEFQYLLTDAEVAAVATYIRSNWGNTGGLVTEQQVAEQR
ncbi:MAG: cytochrome c [Woeseiaceae bacterium]